MLQNLNARIQGWFAWIIISLVALTFALFGVEHYMQSRAANLAKAEVNGSTISLRDFELYYRRNQRMNESTELDSIAEQKRKQEMVDQMIMQNLMIQSALSNGFYITSNQAISQIQAIPQFQKEGHFSVDRYQQALSNALFTPASFQAEVRDELLVNQQRFAFSSTAFSLPSELEQFVKLYQQTRDYDYLVIPYQSFVQQVKIDDREIEAYYQQHHDSFKTPEQVAIEYVRLSMPDVREKVKVSEEDVKRYYDENKSNFVTPAKWHVAHILLSVPSNATATQQQEIEQKANQIYQSLKKSPTQFEQFVKTESDDKISVMKAGVLPWIVAGQSEFDKVLVDLTTIGAISAPAKTTQGYEIFKLIGYKPAQVQPFDAVKANIKNQLALDEVQAQYSRALEQLSDLAYQTPDSLTPIAQALNLTIQRTAPFSREGGQEDIAKNKKILQSAFSREILEQGNNSEPVQLDNETVVVLRLTKHLPASEKTLSEVKADISALLRKSKAELEAKQLGQKLLALKNNSNIEKQVLDENHLKWQRALNVERNTKAVPHGINHAAFELGRVGSLAGEPLSNGDFVLIKLTQIHEGKLSELNPEQRASLRQNIAISHGALDYDLYQKALLGQATIIRY